MGELSTEEVSKEFEIWLQPGGAQSRFDHQNRFAGVVVMRFGYALHGIYGTTEVVLNGSDPEENHKQIERASDALRAILANGKRLAASYVWRDNQMIIENQHRQL